MKKNLFLLTAAVLSCGLLSCSSNDEDENLGEAKQVINMLSEAHPIRLTPEQRVFVNDNNSFTLNFLKTVNEVDRSGKSYIYSPLSITYVLGMVNDAAEGTTEQELEQTLGFHEGGIQAVNEYCKKLIDNLPKVDNNAQLNIANAIFLNKKFTLKQQFQEDMKQYYDAAAEALDFSSPATCDHINGWCKEKTNGMIPSILDEVKPDVVSYLLNAIYFKADWASKFDEKNTKTEAFTTEDGKAQLPMMHQNVLIQYVKNPMFAAVKIPYGNGMWNMTVLLPEDGYTTENIINHLAEFGLGGIEGAYCATEDNLATTKQYFFYPHEVDLKMPHFETTSDTDQLEGSLIELLKKMGIRLAFDAGLAEIPNMANVPVFISMMRQKAAVKVNEEGSEAADVTSFEPEPATYPKAEFHANRPFVYLISEASSNVILFIGKFNGK